MKGSESTMWVGTPTEAVSERDLQGYFAHKEPPPLDERKVLGINKHPS